MILAAAQVPTFASRATWIDLVIVLAYLAVIMWIGVRFARRQKTMKEYFLAGQNMGWLPVGLSLMGAIHSGIQYIQGPSVAIRFGLGQAFQEQGGDTFRAQESVCGLAERIDGANGAQQVERRELNVGRGAQDEIDRADDRRGDFAGPMSGVSETNPLIHHCGLLPEMGCPIGASWHVAHVGENVHIDTIVRASEVGEDETVIGLPEPLVINRNFVQRASELGSKPIGDSSVADMGQSYAGVPILAGGEAFGVIAMYGTEEDAFSESSVNLLTTLANSMGTLETIPLSITLEDPQGVNNRVNTVQIYRPQLR